MIEVTVGAKNFRGVVCMTFTQYLRELQQGGNKYHNVYCKHGVESFRAKYFREVRNVEKVDQAYRMAEDPTKGSAA